MKASRQVSAPVAAWALCSQLAPCVSTCTTAVSLIKTAQDGFIIYHAQTKQQIAAQVGSSFYASHLHSFKQMQLNSSKQAIISLFHIISNPSFVNNPTIRHHII
jgi:hypothetical protein